MAVLIWDAPGTRTYETGVDRGVLYIPNPSGVYDNGVAWNGLTTVTESPSGADASPQYADNIKYLNLIAAEDFGGTIEAFTYPKEFAACDGTLILNGGVAIGQQTRKSFGLSYRTKKGNDLVGNDFGYKVHLVYGALAAPSEKAFATINDSPEALAFSWTFSTTGASISTLDGSGNAIKPSAILTIDSTQVPSSMMTTLNNALYGTAGTAPRLPLPDEVIAMFAGAVTIVTAAQPGFVAATGVITIPTITGVTYFNGTTGAVLANGSTFTIPVSGGKQIITAAPSSGLYALDPTSDDDWSFTRT